VDRACQKHAGPRVTGIGSDGAITQGVNSISLNGTHGADLRDAHAVVLEIVMEMSPSAVTELEPDTELIADLGYDSLGLLELIVALEDTLDLPPIDVEELAEIERVADLERVVSRAGDRIHGGREPA